METITAILSWDSDIASSVPFKPSYLTGTKSRFTSTPSANSPIATETPPAPKSLHFLISFVAFGFLNNLCIFLSSGALPFWTSASHNKSDLSLCSLEDPVAPPQPSLPVLPPIIIMLSVGIGDFLTTFSTGAAATTAPTSILFALYPSW